MIRSRQLTIFEGPSGAGKSQLARAYAERTGAQYVKCGAHPSLGTELPRMYAKAMMPAVLGHCDVVMDRCWLSERVFGRAYRDGADRVGRVKMRMLERLAWRCQTTVVALRPDWDVVVSCNFGNRPIPDRLKTAYDFFADLKTSLPIATLNPHNGGTWMLYETLLAQIDNFVAHRASRPHDIAIASAGNLQASTLMVTPNPPPVGPTEPAYRWPFGCWDDSIAYNVTAWLPMPENELLWLHIGDVAAWRDTVSKLPPDIVATDDAVADALWGLGVRSKTLRDL